MSHQKVGRGRKVVLYVVSLMVALGSQGCFSPVVKSPKFIDEVRPIPPSRRLISYTIQRRDLHNALTKIRENPIRLVPVFQTVSSVESYEYRVFDITRDSVYGLLGLENSDIIVAANRYLVKNPAQFPAFVQLLAHENEATIEIRRGGEARLHKYTFIPAVAAR
jgi:type II secretory pathway component PulC